MLKLIIGNNAYPLVAARLWRSCNRSCRFENRVPLYDEEWDNKRKGRIRAFGTRSDLWTTMGDLGFAGDHEWLAEKTDMPFWPKDDAARAVPSGRGNAFELCQSQKALFDELAQAFASEMR